VTREAPYEAAIPLQSPVQFDCVKNNSVGLPDDYHVIVPLAHDWNEQQLRRLETAGCHLPIDLSNRIRPDVP
jgi:hypothetical protein